MDAYIAKLKDWKIALLIFTLLAIIFTFPVYQNINNWGMHDWDQHFFYEGVATATITQYSQIPLWNPWQCGGNVLLANPQSPFISIHFPLSLLAGEVIGMKIAITLYLILGLMGMWLLSRHLKMGTLSSYIPPIILFLSGVYAIRTTVGHTNWFHLAWIPLVFLFFLKAKENKYYAIPASFCYALIFLGGGIHPFVIATLILAIHTFIQTIKERNTKTLLLLLIIFILFIPFAAVKLIPMLSVYPEMISIEQTDAQPISIPKIITSLIDRTPDLTETEYSTTADGSKLPWGFHEYYGYIGFLPLLLLIATIASWQYIAAIIIVIFLMLSQQFLPQLWDLIYTLPLASVFHGPSRFIFAAIFFIALSIGLGLSKKEKKPAKYTQIALIILFLLLCIDLSLVNTPLFNHAFQAAPIEDPQQTSFATVYAVNLEAYTQQYPFFLQNKGIYNCYERFHVEQAPIPQINTELQKYSDYIGEVYLEETNTVLQHEFTPNKITVQLNNNEGTLIVNQNYITGWYAKIDGESQKATNHNGLIATTVTKENKEVIFYYRPTAFLLGIFVTFWTILISLFIFVPKALSTKSQSKAVHGKQ